MRHWLIIVLLNLQVLALAQKRDTSFFDIKLMLTKQLVDFNKVRADSVYYKSFNRDTIISGNTYTINALSDTFFEKKWQIAGRVKGKDYPDVYFETIDGQAKALSDYKADAIFLIYNYAFCQSCLDLTDTLLDSLQPFMSTNRFQVINLLADSKEDGQHYYERYNTRVQLGFISKEQETDYTLNMGTPFLFVLDRNRKVLEMGHLFDITRYNHLKSLILRAIEKN